MNPVAASLKILGAVHAHSDIKHQFHRSVEMELGSRTPRTPTTVSDVMGHIRVDAKVTRKDCTEGVVDGTFGCII